MTDPAKLAELITEFFRHVEPEIEEFEQAVNEFKERVPDLAEGLRKKIEQSHKTNPAFKKAFGDFYDLCRTSLNPNLSPAAVDEMLIQHILTERLIREIFDNPEFVRRNVIAAEVEKVMQAMTSQSFDRNTYLRELDRFYIAIELAARTMTDWSDKQYFLNTVYERFFQGYSVKLADTMGIVYTPQEIVDFMCASVAEVLEKEFGKHLWSDDVFIIDPCTGTGNFIVNLIRRMPKAKLPDVYKHRLFANEIMLLPYYIAALNIEHAHFEQTGTYEPFEGLCFVDTLDVSEHAQQGFSFLTQANTERVRRQKAAPIRVVIGNPPYNMGQQDENDNNKNRKYEGVDSRIAATYARDSRASLKNKLYDPYVKFFRWAVDRLGDRDGIVCFVTNNSFVDQVAFDGMRKHLVRDFTQIYHVDLHGNVRQNPKLSGTTHNVFGIQVGVGITVAIRKADGVTATPNYHRVPETWRKEEKLAWLAKCASITGVPWLRISPDAAQNWIGSETSDEFSTFVPMGLKEGKGQNTNTALFDLFSLGVATNRDEWAYGFAARELDRKIRLLIKNYNSEVFRLSQEDTPPQNIEDFVNADATFMKWTDRLKESLRAGTLLKYSDEKIRSASYRPFVRKVLYFDHLLNQRRYQQHRIFPTPEVESENRAVWVKTGCEWPMFCLMTDRLVDLLPQGGSQCFPFYTYDEDGSNRKENITDWALEQFRSHYNDPAIDKWSIFHYVYGLLHHPGYREKFADNLKRELPRIPFAPQSEIANLKSPISNSPFWSFSTAGQQLAALHLDYEKLTSWPLEFLETPGQPLSYRVEDKMRLSKDKTRLTVNPSLTLTGIPPEAFAYRLGNRSALEWVIDQYQVYTDPRSSITSDPNREDDPQYIVRLVGQVIRVSIETMKIVRGLPPSFGEIPNACETPPPICAT